MDEKRVPVELGYAATMAPRLEVAYMRAGKFLVTGANAVLPGRCVLCGEVAEGGPEGVKVRAIYSFSLGGWAPHVFMGVSFCRWHGRWRRWAKGMQLAFAVVAVGLLASVVVIGVSGVHPSWMPGRVGILGLFGGLGSALIASVCAVVATRGPVFHHRVGDHYYFVGVSEKFLAGLEGPGEGKRT